MVNRNKVNDVLEIVCPSSEWAEDALNVLRACIAEITWYPEDVIDMTAWGGQVNLMETQAVREGKEKLRRIENEVVKFLQEQ